MALVKTMLEIIGMVVCGDEVPYKYFNKRSLFVLALASRAV